MKPGISIRSGLVLILLLGAAGLVVPWLYESSGLNQRSTPDEWKQIGRIYAGSFLAALLLPISIWCYWRYWRDQKVDENAERGVATKPRGGQFSLRFILIMTTCTAFMLAIGRELQMQSGVSLASICSGAILISCICGWCAAHFVNEVDLASQSIIDSENQDVPGGLNGKIKLIVILAIGLVATGISYKMKTENSPITIGLLVLFFIAIWRSPRPIFARTCLFLSVLYLPFTWLVTLFWDSRSVDFLDLIGLIPTSVGILPAVLILGHHHCDAAAAICVVALSTLGFIAARQSRRIYGWAAGLACFLSFGSSFILQAMFRA